MSKIELELPQEVRDKLKQERMQQYAVRIYQARMDITAYKAVGDKERLTQSEKSLNSLIIAYQAIEGM